MSATAGQKQITDRAAATYQPILPLFFALCTGITIDRYFPLPVGCWLSGAAFLLSFWCWAYWRKAALWKTTILLLLCAVAAGAGWRHQRWRLFPEDDLSRFGAERTQPLCLEAIALKSPRTIAAPPPTPLRVIPRGEQSRLEVRIAKVRDGEIWRAASGKAMLTVEGHLLDVRAGDRIKIYAMFSKPSAPMNPGEFDFARFERTSRRLSTLNAQFPDCVSVVQRGSRWTLHRQLSALNDRGNQLLWKHIGNREGALASAILLGGRGRLDQERTESFFVTGAIHLLAISGLHLGILAFGFWRICRAVAIPRRWSLIAVALLAIFYTLLVDARPPIVRAMVLIVMFCAARYFGRKPASLNSLAIAGILLLSLSPAQLFQVGAQLSFLATATLIGIYPKLISRGPQDPLDRLIQRTRPLPLRMFKQSFRFTWRIWLLSALVWAVALPLVMHRFHLCSSVALVLNPLLWAPIGAALLSGFGVLVFGQLAPPLASLCGWVCELNLSLTEKCISTAQLVPGGHFWTPGPPIWWILGFYAAVGSVLAFPRSMPPLRWSVAILFVWIALGLGFSNHRLWPPSGKQAKRLDCTFVSVGHGTCVVLELPDGKTLLYDAGRLGDPASGARPISAFLWSRGITHLDAVVISHADADHYNALPELIERFSVGTVYVSPVMFLDETPALADLENAIKSHEIPIKQLYSGDLLRTSPEVRIEILHPPQRGTIGSDNANSIVLEIEFAGRRILLPGDLESPGLEAILAEEPLDCDVVMAPHHGSSRSNPQGFAAWSTPDIIVVSSGRNSDITQVREAYQNAGGEVLQTSELGAVGVSIEEGQIRTKAWRKDPW